MDLYTGALMTLICRAIEAFLFLFTSTSYGCGSSMKVGSSFTGTPSLNELLGIQPMSYKEALSYCVNQSR
jgi:hypothetical protein